MMGRTGVHVPNFATERVLAAIAAIPTEEFYPVDIYRHVPDLKRETVRTVLKLKTKQGALTRTRSHGYRKGGIRIQAQNLPSGLVAQAVWTVFFTDSERRFMRLAEIVGEAETVIGRPGISIYAATNVILHLWHRSGHLERIGTRREYAYRLRKGITARPVIKA
jgi:hypothetical protein